MFLCHLLPLLLSLQKAASFAPSRHQRSRLTSTLSNDYHSWSRQRPWHVTLYATEEDNDDDDDADYSYDDDDEEEEESDVEYGKFEKESKMHREEEEEEGSGLLPPLPDFLKDDEDRSTSNSLSSSLLDETQRRIEKQQQQIDMLMKLVQQQQQLPPLQQQLPPLQHQQQSSPKQFNLLSETPSSTELPTISDSDAPSTAAAVAPLKAMLFIDGTWLYYSIHERSELHCPIVRAYGRGWQTRYQFDWAELIRVVCEQLQQQHPWTSQNVEITRASVYTSCKKETSVYSNRIKMFEEMRANNYDVFMMETVGPGEKCVDIQLAVEMLHYATVPNAYDVAILLRY